MLPRTPFSTPLSGSAKETERRIRNIFQGQRKRPPVPVLILGALVILLCGSLVSCQTRTQAGMPEDSPLVPKIAVPYELEQTSGGVLQGGKSSYPLTTWTDWSSEEISFSYEETRGREDILLEYGFQDAAPFYTCYDSAGNLQLELYFNDQTGIGCGFLYEDWNAAGTQMEPAIYGFAFRLVDDAAEVGMTDVWGSTNPYSVLSVYGTDGADSVSGYQESITYNSAGKPERFLSTGILLDNPETNPANILDIAFEYREDGSLRSKQYVHNSMLFGTTYCSSSLLYDEAERLIYARSYITHGTLEYYYVYENGSSKPSYCFYLDHDLGLYGGILMKLAG